MVQTRSSFALVALVVVGIAAVTQAHPHCTNINVRTLDGTCNNIIPSRRLWGSASQYFLNGNEGVEPYPWIEVGQVRPLPTYGNASTLPSPGPRGNARAISNLLATRAVEDAVTENGQNMFAVAFGQFINHDFEDNAFINFSSRAYFPLVSYLSDPADPTCAPVPPVFPYRCNPTNTMLTSEARFSMGDYDNIGRFKVQNNATSYLDLNTVYSTDSLISEALRTLSGGRMKTSTVNITFAASPIPGSPKKNFVFYDTVATWNDTGVFNANPTLLPRPRAWVWTSGDGRVNENAGLMIMHLIWTREHNHNADAVLAAHPHWDPVEMDEEIFQRARAITIAKYQKVVFDEYVPNEFGAHFSNMMGEYTHYKRNLNPNTRLAFASAAFRYGHVAMNSWHAIDQCGVNTQFGTSSPTAPKIPFLSMVALGLDSFTPPGVVGMAGSFENIVRGLIDQLAAPMTLGAPNDLRNLRLPTGVLDLITLDIIRGRHNQLPNYQKIRSVYYDIESGHEDDIYGAPGCPSNLKNNLETADPLACFEIITGAGSPRAQDLKNLYNKVLHIDAFIGMLSEPHVPGTNFGRTTGNIIIDQYRAARDADRFYYERLLNIGYFPPSVAQEIRDTTMASVIRRAFPGIVVPDTAFHKDTAYRTNLAATCA